MKRKKIKSYPLIFPKHSSKLALTIIIITIALSIFGCLMVYSASYYNAEYYYGNEYHFLTKQIIGVVLGIGAMIATYYINYRKYLKYKWIAVGVAFFVLILVFVPGIGVSNYGANRWIGLPGFTIQGSEIAKFCFVIFAAAYLFKLPKNDVRFRKFLPILIIGCFLCLLILLEPNMSITICLGSVMLIMLFLGGMKIKHFVILSIPVLCLIPLLIIAEPYRLDRLLAFVNPWASPQAEGFQLIQSLYSLGSGGLFGVGLFNSRQKFLYLPFSESDFVFSIIGEEFGLVGATLLICVFIYLIKTLFKVAKNCPDRFGFLLVSGIASIIAVQILINLAVVTGSIPPTGVPLPFISAGSSSLIVFMASIGIVLNVNKMNSIENSIKVKNQSMKRNFF